MLREQRNENAWRMERVRQPTDTNMYTNNIVQNCNKGIFTVHFTFSIIPRFFFFFFAFAPTLFYSLTISRFHASLPVPLTICYFHLLDMCSLECNVCHRKPDDEHIKTEGTRHVLVLMWKEESLVFFDFSSIAVSIYIFFFLLLLLVPLLCCSARTWRVLFHVRFSHFLLVGGPHVHFTNFETTAVENCVIFTCTN